MGFERSSKRSRYSVFRPSHSLDVAVGSTVAARAGLRRVVEAAESDAHRIARVDAYDTGRYDRSIRSGVTLQGGRWVGYLSAGGAEAWYATIIEFHPFGGKVRAVLRRAVEGKGRFVNRRNHRQ